MLKLAVSTVTHSIQQMAAYFINITTGRLILKKITSIAY